MSTGDDAGTPAQLQWDASGQPVSSTFGDVYFSRANGLEESRHVFLHHNALEERWRHLTAPVFVIGETGFGSGLNFLAAWQLWQQTAPPGAQLHFVSVEKYPLHKDDLKRALALWPELADFSQALIDAYPDFVGTGFHRLNFAEGRVRLTLIIDDAATGLEQLLPSTHPMFEAEGPKVDAWFLDGFAPARNPQMWSDELFAAIGKLSHADTTAATFSSAGVVKRGLQTAGFKVAKVPGFGHKREMIRAWREVTAGAGPALIPEDFTNHRGNNPWPVPWQIVRKDCRVATDTRSAVVIGAGLAGSYSARALADRGWQVTVLERGAAIAGEASGNSQGILYARLSPRQEPQAAFNLACLQYAQRLYRRFWEQGDTYGQACGVLHLAYTPAEADLQQQLLSIYENAGELVKFVDADEASALAGIPVEHSGLYFPNAGWLKPPALCAALLDHPNIQVRTGCDAGELIREDCNWTITDHNGGLLARAPVVIFANARDALGFHQTAKLPIQSIRGQVTYLPANALSRNLRTVLCSEGYLSPVMDGQHCAGATFNLRDERRELRMEDHQTNLDNLACHSTELAASYVQTDPATLDGRVGFRCATRDYLPMVGPLPDFESFIADYAPLRKNAKAAIPEAGKYWPGLYANLGHGSRGLTYIPLCAELLAAQINNEPAPFPRDLMVALNPARFIIRDLIRNKS